MSWSRASRWPWLALALVALSLASSVDLHVLFERGASAHGIVVSEVSAEECSHGDARHVEAQRLEGHDHCALCLRTLQASKLLPGWATVGATEQTAVADQLPQVARYEPFWQSPAPVRGPPES